MPPDEPAPGRAPVTIGVGVGLGDGSGVGLGDAIGVGLGVGSGVGVGVGAERGATLGLGSGVGLGLGVDFGVGLGVGFGVGFGVGLGGRLRRGLGGRRRLGRDLDGSRRQVLDPRTLEDDVVGALRQLAGEAELVLPGPVAAPDARHRVVLPADDHADEDRRDGSRIGDFEGDLGRRRAGSRAHVRIAELLRGGAERRHRQCEQQRHDEQDACDRTDRRTTQKPPPPAVHEHDVPPARDAGPGRGTEHRGRGRGWAMVRGSRSGCPDRR